MKIPLTPVAELLVEVHQHMTVSDMVVGYALDGLSATFRAQWNLLDPTLNVVLGGKVQHADHLRTVANVRRTEVAAGGSKVLCVEGGERVVAETNAVEATHDFKGLEEVGLKNVLVERLMTSDRHTENLPS